MISKEKHRQDKKWY